LCDKETHFIPWEDGFNPKHTWEEEFNLTPSELRYNRGELHNLSVKHGTLTDEERFVINDHIIQTITMLKRIPYPEHLRNVPNIAGSHHERMDGNGYPRGLKGEALSVQERVMVIADIFEALTSSDRPYKKTHNISESLTIMTDMATSGHIDPKLYLLFLEKTIDSVYGYDFLNHDENLDAERAYHLQRVRDFIGDSF
jgi:HD-GYP domain-containing protein (c-di-GMP phosphodiesterase class II)